MNDSESTNSAGEVDDDSRNVADELLRSDADVEEAAAGIPALSQIQDFFLYSASLPERALRSSSAVLGGALRESSYWLIPSTFRNSKSYSTFVQQMLEFMTHGVGGVGGVGGEKKEDPENPEVENYVARKVVGGFMDLAGMATLHLSPITILAVVSDVAYGSQTYLKELSDELKKHGVIDENSTIDHAADLLAAIKETTGKTADAFDVPPLSVEGLQESIKQAVDAASGIDPSRLIPQGEMERLWNDMHQMANKESVGMMEISSAMSMYTIGKIGTVGRGALSTVTVAGNMFDRHITQHYADSLNEINDKGFYATFAESSRPYIDAVWYNFHSERATITEDLLTGKLITNAFTGMYNWFAGSGRAEEETAKVDGVGPETAEEDSSVADELDSSRHGEDAEK
jgi:hypothetical protein